MSDFPFGIDPSGSVPVPELWVSVEVEGVGDSRFHNGRGPIAYMADSVVAVHGRQPRLMNGDVRSYVTVTGWDPDRRQLKVRLNKKTVTPDKA